MADAKSYLQQIRILDCHIENKLEELSRLRALSTKVTAAYNKNPTGNSGHDGGMIGAVSKIVDLENEINAAIDRFVDKKREVERVLQGIDDHDQLTVLYKRYFGYESFEQIAAEMNFTYRNVCYLHGKALREVDRKLTKGER